MSILGRWLQATTAAMAAQVPALRAWKPCATWHRDHESTSLAVAVLDKKRDGQHVISVNIGRVYGLDPDEVPDARLQELIRRLIAHELAHVLARVRWGAGDGVHGRRFVTAARTVARCCGFPQPWIHSSCWPRRTYGHASRWPLEMLDAWLPPIAPRRQRKRKPRAASKPAPSAAATPPDRAAQPLLRRRALRMVPTVLALSEALSVPAMRPQRRSRATDCRMIRLQAQHRFARQVPPPRVEIPSGSALDRAEFLLAIPGRAGSDEARHILDNIERNTP